MARFAIIDAGRVVNIAEADDVFAASLGWIPALDASIGDLWDGTQFSRSPGPSLATLQAASIKQIDTDTDAIYGDVLGKRTEEYVLAATEAQAYKDAGCSGAAPSSVQSWATAKTWTATQATDDILATAAAWRGAQIAIRSARLARKEQVRTAIDSAGITTAMTAWAGFVAYMRGQLGI